MIQADGCKRRKALPGQRGQAALDDHFEIEPLDLHVSHVDVDIAALGAASQQQAEADKLADDGRPARAGNPQIHTKNQNRIQRNIQHCAADDADHGIAGASLKTQLVIQHQRSSHPRRAQQNDPQIILGIGEDGLGGAQKIRKRLQKDLTEDADHNAGCQSGEKSGGSHVGCFLIVFLTQLPGDVIAAALTEEEAHSLDNGHHGENHTHGTGSGIAVEFADEIGIGHIVEGRDQHTDDAGDSQLADQSAHRGLGHHFVFGFVCIHCSSPAFVKFFFYYTSRGLKNLHRISTADKKTPYEAVGCCGYVRNYSSLEPQFAQNLLLGGRGEPQWGQKEAAPGAM